MKAIVAVDLNWGIGYNGDLLQFIPEDMKFFKQMTIRNIVIMGRETFESLPSKKPLKDRINIVLSKNESFKNEGLIICRSLDDLFRELKNYNTDNLFVIGGEKVYSQLLPYCTEAYVTKIKNKYVADKYFINLDEDNSWTLQSESEIQKYNDIQFTFNKYINTTPINMKM